jgi:predicted AAA+ superfamily ATPase
MLGYNWEALMDDYKSFGFFFESLCVRDLRIHSQPLGGNVSYFRDKNGREVDIIVSLQNGKWGAVEVKLGSSQIDEGAANLLSLKDRIDTDVMRHPSFLAVITAGQIGYPRPDGVSVIPIGCLGD